MICIIGINGRQGKRYKAICEYLNIPHIGFDSNAKCEDEYKYVVRSNIEAETIVMNSDKIILATHTRNHLRLIERFGIYQKPILCETPIVKTREELQSLEKMKPINDQIYMVNHLAYRSKYETGLDSDNRTYYNYYKSYNEGVEWDAMQVIGLAREGYEIKNDSPILDLKINGLEYTKTDIDILYKLMVQDFNGAMGNLWNIDDIKSVTNKVLDFIERNRK